jgi:hypothetical protein
MDTLDYDIDLEIVRLQLDGLAAMRSRFGLSLANEYRYRDLCYTEQTLIALRAGN